MLRCIALLALMLASAFHAADAAIASGAVRVVWARNLSAYIEAGDSATFSPGDRVVFVSRGHTVAEGSVTRVDRGGLALVALTMGSLGAAKRLDRVRVFVERSTPRAPSSLTVGCPALSRKHPLVGCGGQLPPASLPPVGYRVGSRSTASCRLEREPGLPGSTWPDTLIVRWFEDPADEGIAFDRGEIDVALFWPGELSAHAREQPRWQGSRLGTRSRGVIVAFAVSSCAPSLATSRAPSRADSAMLDPGVRTFFRGDVAPWGVQAPNAAGTHLPVAPDSMPVVVADAEPGCAGLRSVERYLNRSPAAHPTRPCLRLSYLGAAGRSPDSLALAVAGHVRRGTFAPELKTRADSLERAIRARAPDAIPLTAGDVSTALRDSFGVVQLLAIRCPVVSAPELRAYLDTLGVDAFADLIGRLPAGNEP